MEPTKEDIRLAIHRVVDQSREPDETLVDATAEAMGITRVALMAEITEVQNERIERAKNLRKGVVLASTVGVVTVDVVSRTLVVQVLNAYNNLAHALGQLWVVSLIVANIAWMVFLAKELIGRGNNK